jgi:membrane-associated phospholipid phosphatase
MWAVVAAIGGILPDRGQRILIPVTKRLKRLDLRILRLMRTRGHPPAAETGMKALGMAGEWGSVWIAIGLAGALVDRERRTRWLRAVPVAPAAVGLNFLVKLAVRRERPRLRRLPPLAGAPSELSFPSAHATASLAAATAMGRVLPRARLPLYALAGAICVARPYLGMHYPSDVLAGAALGLGIGAVWPGLRGPGTEDRLIDLVVDAAREASGDAGDGSGPNGDRPQRRVPDPQPPEPRPDPKAQ